MTIQPIFDTLEEAIARVRSSDLDMIGYHTYAGKGGYYFAYKHGEYEPNDNEYEYLDLRKVES